MIRLGTGATLALALGSAAPLTAQLGSHNPEPGPQETVAIVGARLVPVAGDVIANGTLVISNGRIAAIGSDVEVPSGARVIDGSGLSVYPGMMDAATSMGLIEIEQGANATIDVSETGNFNPNAQALWGIDPHSAHVGVTRVAGITHVVSRPTGGIISGQAAVINLAGYTAPVMAVDGQSALVIQLPGQGGRGGGRFGGGQASNPPAGAMTPLDSLKQILDDARAYDRAIKAYDSDASLPRPTVDLGLAALVPAVNGEMPVIFPAETEAAMRQYTTQVLGSRRVVELLFHSKVARGFLTGIPGLTEWAILGKAWAYTRSAGFPLPDGHAPYDLVILDAPASGDGTKMLRIPDIIADMGASGQIRRDADRCRAMLRDPQKTALVLVTLAEELVLQETEENIEIVRRELQIPLGPLFVNKIQPPPFAESELPLVLDHSPSQDPACQELLCLGQRHAHRQVRQEAHLGRLTRWNLPVVQLPRIAPPFEGLRSLEKLQMALAEGG